MRVIFIAVSFLSSISFVGMYVRAFWSCERRASVGPYRNGNHRKPRASVRVFNRKRASATQTTAHHCVYARAYPPLYSRPRPLAIHRQGPVVRRSSSRTSSRGWRGPDPRAAVAVAAVANPPAVAVAAPCCPCSPCRRCCCRWRRGSCHRSPPPRREGDRAPSGERWRLEGWRRRTAGRRAC